MIDARRQMTDTRGNTAFYDAMGRQTGTIRSK
jgi:hypothetical protein